MPGGLIFGLLAHTRGSVLDALGYQGPSPLLVCLFRREDQVTHFLVQASIFCTTLPPTSVSRKSRPI